MGKPEAPSPPNPYQTAAAQTGTNVSTGVANAFLNNVNQTTPEGSLSYDVTGNYSWNDPSTGKTYNIPRFTSTQTLSPAQQAQQAQNDATKLNLATMGNQQSQRIMGVLGKPFNPNTGAPTGGNAQNILDVGQARTSFDPGGQVQRDFADAGDITRSYGAGDFSQDRQRVEDSLMDRINPQLARERSNIETRLADQGIRYGSQAYASAMDDYNRQATDTRFGAISQAGQEQQRMMDMAAQRAGFENAAQQQTYDQALGRGTFGNQALAQQFQQNAALGSFENAGLAQQQAQQEAGFNAANSQRNQYMQEQYAQRNQPLNEISALMGGGAVQAPNWLNSPQSQIPTTDFAGIMNQNFQNQMGIYGQQNQNWQSMMGGILGLGAGAMKFSDERLKKNVDKVGTVFAYDENAARKKLPIYEYEYKNGDGARHTGPMAQDVEKIDRGAVHEIGGRKAIDTQRVMGNILEGGVMVYEPQNNPFASFFFANGPGVNLKLREKIALAQMMQKQKYPKTFGEGLSAIGESLGEIGTARRLEEQDRLSQQAAMTLGGTPAPTPEAAAASIVPGGPQTAAPPPFFTPDQDPTSQAPVPPTVQEGGPAPTRGPQFRPRQPVRTASNMGPIPPSTAPGDLPPTGEPGNTGATTFQPPFQPPPPPLAGEPAAAPPPPPAPPAGPTVANYGQRSILAPTPPPGAEPPPGAPPIMAQGGGEDPRRAIGLSLLRQQMGGQGAPPAPAPAEPPPATRSAAPPPDQGIQPAPAPPQIQPMPPASPAYVPPDPGTPAGAPLIPPSAQEMRLQTILNANQGNPYAGSSPAAIELGQLQKAREQKQTEANELFKSRITQANEQAKLRQQALIDQEKRTLDNQRGRIEVGDLPTKLAQEAAKRQIDLTDAQEKSVLQNRFGGRDPEKVFTTFDTEKESAKKATHALTQYGIARDLLDKGVIVGTGQGWKVNAAKVAGMYGGANAAARTEEMQAAIKSTLSIAIENIQGAGGKVSDTDVQIASGTIGADPALQMQTIRNLVTRGEKAARSKLNEYEDQVDYHFGGTRAERRYQVPAAPTAPEPHVRTLLDNKQSDDVKAEFDKRFGPGAADLEIARAKRRERRGG